MEEQIINAACASVTEEGIWFVHYVLGLLMFYDKKRGEVTRARVIEKIDTERIAPYLGIYVYNDEIYLFPNNAKRILVYKISIDTFEDIGIEFDNSSLFRAVYRVEEKLYVIPYKYQFILKMDLNSADIIQIDGFKSQFSDGQYINSCCMFLNKYIACAIPNTCTFALFDIEKERWKKIITPGKNLVYIVSSGTILYGFEKESKKVVGFNMNGDIVMSSECTGITNAELFCLPNKKIVVNDVATGEILVYDSDLKFVKKIVTNIIRSKISSDYLHGLWVCKKDISYCITKGNELIVVNDNGDWTINKLSMNEKLWKKSAMEYMRVYGPIIEENEFLTLDSFIDNII